MARLVGVDLPREKRMEIALTYIYGIGRTRAVEALTATAIDLNKLVPATSVATPPARRPGPVRADGVGGAQTSEGIDRS